MNRIMKQILILIAGILFFVGSMELFALPKFMPKKEKSDQVQKQSIGVFDLQSNTVSNLQFYLTNYGIFGLNVARNEGGGFWPRGSYNQYIFGGGVWFACQKPHPQIPGEIKKYCTVTYNPNTGGSWMVPGRIEDGEFADQNDINKYRIYFSTDFNNSTGEPLNSTEGQNWPIWDTEKEKVLMTDRYFGRFEIDPAMRSRAAHDKGPAFISGEDIFTTYKDTDLSRYEGGATKRRNEGYPLKLQFEQTIYSWGFGDYRDFIFLRYDIINYSNDTLWECWMAPVMDVDIAIQYNSQRGAGNDRVRFYFEGDSLNLAIQWSNDDQGEKGFGFGYLGFDFLESPAVIKVKDSQGGEIITDSSHFIRKDKPFYSNNEQLGLVTFRNWPIEDDKQQDDERYNFLSARTKDGDFGPGDKRFCMATGPFNVRPRDTVRVVVGMILASKSVRSEPDGSTEDVQALVTKDIFAQYVYDNNFRAPRAPERTKLFWNRTLEGSLNNAVMVNWDSTAELSLDQLEGGLSFMGYKLYRARRTDLDTFSVDNIKTTPQHVSGSGPHGWKEVGSWSIPSPFVKSSYRANNSTNTAYPLLDSLVIIGPYIDPVTNKRDTFAMQVMRIPKGVILWPDNQIKGIMGRVMPVIADIDTGRFNEPWNKFIRTFTSEEELYDNTISPVTNKKFLFYGKEGKSYRIFDECMVGVAKYTSSLVPYNPLFFNRTSIKSPWPKSYLDTIPDKGVIFQIIDALVDSLDSHKKPVWDSTKNPPEIIKVWGKLKTTRVDTVYIAGTSRTVRINNQDQHWVDVYLPLNIDTCMNDIDRVRNATAYLYKEIQKGNVKLDFPEFERTEAVRHFVIEPYLKKITNNRTFVDIGDDDNDNFLSTSITDVSRNEKLINNVDYYYKMLAFDEGDFSQPTPSKYNDASPGLPNLIKTIPGAAEVGKKSNFEIIHVDSNKIGGLYNFAFWPIDQDRVNQMFAGHTLQLEFNPLWSVSSLLLGGSNETSRLYFGLYRTRMTLTDVTTNELLYENSTMYEVTPADFTFRESFTENAASYVLSDSLIVDSIGHKDITFGIPTNKEIILRSGKFSTGNMQLPGFYYTYGFTTKALGTLGFSFDFSIKQYGGVYRADTIYSQADHEVATILGYRSQSSNLLTQTVDTLTLGMVDFNRFYPSYFDAGFNNGPGEYVVEFLPGGKENVKFFWKERRVGNTKYRDSNNVFEVEYLNLKIHNAIWFNRPDPSGDSVKVSYPGEMPHIELPYGPDRYPDPRLLKLRAPEYIGKYNIGTYGWINARSDIRADRLFHQMATGEDSTLITGDKAFTGLQGKYYLSGKSLDGNDVVDFTNIINIGGISFALDKANRGKLNSASREWGVKDWAQYDMNQSDFRPGDKVILKTFGGALGLPLPGAKVLVKVSEATPSDNKFTDGMLNDIHVVPNPYYINHEGVKSPYDGKIYFTKLPKRCTIDIYTINGQHVRKLEHNGNDNIESNKTSVEVFDLLSKYSQRVQSQTLIAVITTPDGAQTTEKFTVVVGGFRLIQE